MTINITLKVFMFLLFIFVCYASDGRCFNPAMFEKIPLVRLKDGSVVKTLTREVPLGCQAACSQTTACKSINIRQRTDGYFDCDLLSENRFTSGRELKPLEGSNYYEVTILTFQELYMLR